MRVKFERQPLSDDPCKRLKSDYRPAYEMKNKVYRSGKNQAGDATSEEPVEKVAELERRQVDGLW